LNDCKKETLCFHRTITVVDMYFASIGSMYGSLIKIPFQKGREYFTGSTFEMLPIQKRFWAERCQKFVC
jgi:hypothetical protein